MDKVSNNFGESGFRVTDTYKKETYYISLFAFVLKISSNCRIFARVRRLEKHLI